MIKKNQQAMHLLACGLMVFLLELAMLGGVAMAQQMATVPVQVVCYADMVIHNGKVVTMDDASTNPVPGTIGQTMAIRDGKILAVGSDPEILLYAGPSTLRIDLHGRSVPEEEIASTYPEMTVVGGRPVFWRESFARGSGHDPVGAQVRYVKIPKTDPNAVVE